MSVHSSLHWGKSSLVNRTMGHCHVSKHQEQQILSFDVTISRISQIHWASWQGRSHKMLFSHCLMQNKIWLSPREPALEWYLTKLSGSSGLVS